MKKLQPRRFTPAALESLEGRRLLSATLVASIPNQTLQASGTGSITLSSFLKDPQLTGGTVIKMATPEGNMYLQLTDQRTPLTVANFVQYINDGEYTPTIIQRSVPGFVLQGGGTKPNGSNNASVSSLQSEAGLSNLTGTIAVALSNGPNTGTNQWFINLADNSSLLDGTNDGGPFTVFGNVIDGTLSVASTIAGLPTIDASNENSNWGGPGLGLPVINYSGDNPAITTVPQNDLVTDNISVVVNAAPTYSVVSNSNPGVLSARVTKAGVLKLVPTSAAASGKVTITTSITDLAGEVTSTSFKVRVVGPAAHIAITTPPPAIVRAGRAIAPNITAAVTDASGFAVSGINVRLAIATGPDDAVLGGSTVAPVINGVVTFSNITLTEAGGYTLNVVHGAVQSAPTATFNVLHSAAAQVAFAPGAIGGSAGVQITPPVVVNVEDQFGNIVTSDSSLVTMVISPGTGPAGAILGGTLTLAAQDGVATFSTLTLSEAGTYTLKAKDGTLTKGRSGTVAILGG